MEATQDERPEDNKIGRRPFLEVLLGFSLFSTLVGVLTPVVGYLIPPSTGSKAGSERVKVGTTSDIPIGGGKIVAVGNKPVIVTNTDQGVNAFSAICTHLGCIVVWDDTRKAILCPCHDGWFNAITGVVMSGPPPSPLASVPVIVDGEDIYIGGA